MTVRGRDEGGGVGRALTLLEGGQGVVFLLVRLSLVEGNTDGNDVLVQK